MSIKRKPAQMPALLKRFWPFIVLACSAIFSTWLYYSSDYKQEQLLISREWQSNTVSRIEKTQYDQLGMLRRIEQTSHMVYLPNKMYSRITQMKLFSTTDEPVTLHISESGKWDVSGGYLLTEPVEFKDITSGRNADFKKQHLATVKEIFRMDAQKSRRIDVLNEKSMLLTSLTYGSSILYSL
ncbi:regulatory protein ToxS [Pseudomonadota bacterium]